MVETITSNYRLLKVYNRRFLKFDLVAAIVVFLVAIPLCLGIALASGTSLFSGILSGIIGGIVVGTISGSHVSISGPAAGMAAVVVTAITQLGGFDTFLLALVLAGLLQLLIGYLRVGFIAEYVPSNVVQGLLCAIGILLIIKQLPFAFSLSSSINELKTHLMETTEGFTVMPLVALNHHINTGAIFLSIVSFSILIYFEKTRNALLKGIPAPIVVVVAGIVLNEIFMYFDSLLVQNSPQLVNIPETDGFHDFLRQLETPNWSALTNPSVYLYGVIIAIVASLETLLNIKAAEKLDNKHRSCSKDRELVAQGTGNLLAGLIGGIPVTSVIVRTSVGIQAGSKTKMTTILHGIFIFIAVMMMPQILNKIPLCSLAAILIHTGFKLSKPAIYKELYAQGLDRFIPFVVTVISILWFNLLTGILIGLAISFFFILRSNSMARIDIFQEFYPKGIVNRLVLPQQVTFLNKASLTAELEAIPKYSQLIIDARYASFIDKEILQLIRDFKEETAPLKQISLNLIGFKDHYDIHNTIDFINVTTFDVQSALTPKEVLHILQEGNQRFLNDQSIHRMAKMDIAHTATTQHPIAVILGCIDSRVPVETVFDMSFGDVFIARVAGNVVNDDILASIEYACKVIGAKLIVVLGHTRCGAIISACSGVEMGHITQLLDKIKPAVNSELKEDNNRESEHFVHEVTELNVANTLKEIYKRSEIIHTMVNKGEVGIVGAVYDVNSGKAEFKDFSPELERLPGEKDTQLISILQDMVS